MDPQAIGASKKCISKPSNGIAIKLVAVVSIWVYWSMYQMA
jgi:hypothetical protein